MQALEHLGTLLLVAALVAILGKRLRLPYTVGLALAGAVLSTMGLLPNITLTQELIFSAFLPPLLFEAAFSIHWEELKANTVPVLTLATLGVVGAAGLVAVGMHYFVGWEWLSAWIFGALIAATDPVSVIAMFKETGITGRVRLLLEAESLLNDGVAAVLFGVLLLLAKGQSVGPLAIGGHFLLEAGGGILCGLLVGGSALLLAGQTDDHLVEITFSTIAAYGSFLLAQHFHLSGVLATIACGLLIGNVGSLGSFTDKGHVAVGAFWEYAAFLANSMVFLLMGAREERLLGEMGRLLLPLSVAITLTLIGRAATVYPLCALFFRSAHRIEVAHQHALFWGGLRGAVALALVLGLPETLPHNHEMLTIAFGIVAFSVILQGLTIAPFLRRLKIL